MNKISNRMRAAAIAAAAFASFASTSNAAPSWTTGQWEWTTFAPSTGNLLLGVIPSVANPMAVNNSSSTPIVLTDAQVGQNVSSYGKWRYRVNSGTALTFDLAGSDAGYDISSIRLFSQFNGGNVSGNDNIRIGSIAVRDFESGEWSAIEGSSLDYQPGGTVNQNYAFLAGSEGEDIAAGIDAIRITFASAAALYAEIEAIGTPVLAGPKVSASQAGGDVDRALIRVSLDYAGTEASSADVYFAYAPVGEPLGEFSLVGQGLASYETSSVRLRGLSAGAAYDYAIVATNNFGIPSGTVTGTFSTPAEGLSVRINEVMASNGTSLLTADGDGSDWVELYNPNDTAVDLSGWRITDNATKAWSKWKELPEGAEIEAGGYLIVWGDDYGYTGWTNGEIHVDMGLSADGENVGLARAEGDIVDTCEFGPQIKDISFGYGRDWKALVDSRCEAEYRVTGSGAWHSVTGGVGFSTTPGSFSCSLYRMNSYVGAIDTAEAYVADRSKWASDPVRGTYDTIHFSNGSGMNYAALPFPGQSSTGDTMDNFVFVAEGVIYVPAAGLWTFAAGTDDGFRLYITGHGQNFTSEYGTGRGYTQSLSTFNFPVAGAYNVRYVMFDQGGASACDFSVAQGYKENWDSSFKLVGDSSGSVIHAGALQGALANDVSAAMAGHTRLDWRTTFDFDGETADGESLELRIRYADGFVATLNGVEIARADAPEGALADDAAATDSRPVTLALSTIPFEAPAALLRQGSNELVVSALRSSSSSSDFIVDAQLVRLLAGDRLYFFRSPTPLAWNGGDGYTPMTPPISFSEPHGYKTAPFQLSLSCESDPSAPIYYTLDGTSPNAATSQRYTGPITISGTTVVRAAVPDERSILQVDSTATYLFLDDILVQSSDTPAGFPENGAVNGQAMRYGMLSEVVNSSTDGARVLAGFTNSICTLSIVTDLANLFDPQKGIYVNAGNDGRSWERAICIEQIDPVNGAANEFTSPAGIRIRGAYSRGSGIAKHSLRLFFRSEYGSGALQFPLFGDEGADRFEKVDLRCSQNWAFSQGSSEDTLIHELFSRDTQRDMGQPYTRTRYYNVFINGIYWGVYMTQERGDKDYAETYLGGDDDDWDVVKTTQPGYVTTAADGTMDAFSALRDIVENEGFGAGHEANYRRVLGQNPDGTRNPAYPILVNATNLMDFMINVHFAVDNDSPAADGMANNMYCLRNRTDASTGFVFLRHDAEHSLRFGGGANTDSLLRGTSGYRPEFANLEKFNPAELHYRLLDNAEYRAAFADRIQKHLFGEGALTAAKAAARFQARMAEIDDAVCCEIARWGQSSWRRQNWLNSCNSCLSFIAQRPGYLVQHYRNHGWFPSIDAPTASAYSGTLDAETPFVLSGPTTFYYTLDGADPRSADGTPAATATIATRATADPVALVSRNGEWRYFDWGTAPAADAGGRAWTDPAYDDSSWDAGPGILGVSGSNGNTLGTATHRYVNHASSGTQVATTYFRKTVSMPAGSGAAAVTRLSGAILFDDGFILYLNGTEIYRENMAAGAATYDTYSSATQGSPNQNSYLERSIPIPAGLLREGDNVFAVEVHDCHGTSTDLYWDCNLSTAVDDIVAVVDLPTEPTRVLARAYDSSTGEWSALTEAVVAKESDEEFAVNADSLRIAEIMSSTADGGGDGSEYIVVTNLDASAAADISGVRITCAKSGGSSPACDFTLPADTRIEAGASLTLAKADYWASGKITNGKVDVLLYDSDGTVIQTLYVDASWWASACDGNGGSFIAKEFGTNVTERSQWRPSSTVMAGLLRVTEVMSSTPEVDEGGDGAEYIVLANLTDKKLSIEDVRIASYKVSVSKKGVVSTNEEASADFTFGDGAGIPKSGTLTLKKADYWPDGKLTNGKLSLQVLDPAGAPIQLLYIDGDWWDGAADGTGASYVADGTGMFVTEISQWHPSFLPPADAAAREVVSELSTNATMRAWFNQLGADADGRAALAAFSGSAAQLDRCYVTGVDPTGESVELKVTGLAIAPDGTVSVSGAIEVGGESTETTVRGSVKLLGYSALDDDTPGVIPVEGASFPLSTDPSDPGDYRFFRLRIE